VTTPRLAIVGAGSLGQAFAGLLALSRQPVTLLGTPTGTERLRTQGQLRLRGQRNADVPVAPPPAPAGTVGLTSDPAELPAGAGLIFLTKGQQLASALATVQAAWPATGDRAAWVAGFQNGLAKDDMLAATFGPDRVVGGVTILGAQREDDGTVAITSLGHSYLGELGGGVSDRAQTGAQALASAGIPADATADIQSVLWSKAANAAGVFGVSVLCRVSAPRLFASPDLMRAYLALVREVVDLAQVSGVQVGDYAGFPIRTYAERPEEDTIAALAARPPLPPASGKESMPSMTQDLLAGRSLEVEQVFGDLVRRADSAQRPAPHLHLVTHLLRGLSP